ncbi:hypothetical protein K7432_008210 [Basidiobolus ranarum]|uniref:Uncharacterized protein n=1 Tax=Basidiobolus ranarum TaxID=34480 RepID=A0ABR2VYY4_9FUNG
MTTEEFDRILQTEPPARLSLVSNRRGSISNSKQEAIRTDRHSTKTILKKQMSFDNFSHKLQHTAPSKPPRTSLAHFNSYAQHNSTPPIDEDVVGSGELSHPESDTEANSDTSSTGPLPVAEKKSLSSLIKKTFGKKSKKTNDKDWELSVPSSPSGSLFSISPQPSPVDSIFDHHKTALDLLRGSQTQRYRSSEEKEEEDWEDNRLPPTVNAPSRLYSTDNSQHHDSPSSAPFQLAPAPKPEINRKSLASSRLPAHSADSSQRNSKVTFNSVEDVIHHARENTIEIPTGNPRSSFSSDDTFHTIEEDSLHISSPQPTTPSSLEEGEKSKENEESIASLKSENTHLLKELEKIKRQLFLEQSARSGLFKSMENARSQFDDISAQAYRKLRQVTSENRRLHSQVKKLKGKLESYDI